MTLKIADRVRETTSTTGTGTWSLAGAVTGFQTFLAAIGNANTTYYAATDGTTSWEVGIGTYTSSGNTLARTTVLASSNSGSAVNFASAPTVWVDSPATLLAILLNPLARTDVGNTFSGTQTFSGTNTTSGQLIGKGTATNDSAAAGYIGEFVSSTVLVGAAIPLTTSTETNITSISLTAGDWDVSGVVTFTGNTSTTITRVIGGVSSTSATLPVEGTSGRSEYGLPSGSIIFNTSDLGLTVSRTQFSLAGTTTVYLIGYASFGISTCSAFGTITARRVR